MERNTKDNTGGIHSDDGPYNYPYRVSAYDPNMCSTARFSPPSYTNHSQDNCTVTYENVILVPNSQDPANMDPNSLITEPDASQAYNISSRILPTEYSRTNIIESNSVEFGEHHQSIHQQHLMETTGSPVTDYQTQNTEIVHSNYMQEMGSGAGHHVMRTSQPAGQIILHRSPNGHLYQNFYIDDNIDNSTVSVNTSSILELVQIGHEVYRQEYLTDKAQVDSDIVAQVEFDSQSKVQDDSELLDPLPDSNFDHLPPAMIANTTPEVFLTNPNHAIHDHHATSSMNFHEKEQQRILLESTMSPLLAAVNDITQREAELDSYLNRKVKGNNLKICTTVATNCRSKIGTNQTTLEDEVAEYMDVRQIRQQQTQNVLGDNMDDEDDDCLLVSDRPIENRARATLPTKYLSFGKNTDLSEEPSVIAKKEIPLKTKFGPFEGDIKSTSEDVLDVLRIQNQRMYPLLVLEETKILEVTNENTSNWMRFVRMAHKFSEQNLLLYEEDRKLFFKCCKLISPKEELKVGYSQLYASRHGLKYLSPTEIDKQDLYEKDNPWLCFECDMRFATLADMQSHLYAHDADDKTVKLTKKKRKIKNTNAIKSIELRKNSSRCLYCMKVFMTSISAKRHMATHIVSKRLSKTFEKENSSVTEFDLKCSTCNKKFNSEDRLKTHRLLHIKNELKSHQCWICPQKCSTMAALTAHVKSHTNRFFTCIYCLEKFKRIPDFRSHVTCHSQNGLYPCKFCKKKYRDYTLVRKHMKIFHPAIKYSCNECDKIFINIAFLKRHKSSHLAKGEFLCSDCGKQFKRKDKLREHIQRLHYDNGIRRMCAKNTSSVKQNSPDVAMKKSSNYPTEEIEMEISEKETGSIQINDYNKCVYKCHDCMIGFKRRGMLVNHIAKRHPNIQIELVPELKLPIMKIQSLFYCQYCPKVYKSNSKRKAHILKNHPGLEPPPPIKSLPAPSQIFAQNIGKIQTDPHRCQWCHKQYASRHKLMLHYRKSHSNMIQRDCQLQNRHQHQTHQQFQDMCFRRPISPENKLLKLSSAALELSAIEDRKFFEFLNERTQNSPTESTSNSQNDLINSNLNFKVGESEFSESSSNEELTGLPQLFEESIACM